MVKVIVDTDAYFEIDPQTRAISQKATAKKSIMQYDHNSERFTFSMPRHVEGQDMLDCSKVEVHYKSGSTKVAAADRKKGVYEVADLRVDPDDADKILCSWLISQNATQLEGPLCFLLRFSSVDEDGNITYAWNTDTFAGIVVKAGIYNSDDIIKQYADVLELWKAELEALVERSASEGEHAEIYNDYEKNLACAPYATAEGSNTRAGAKCFKLAPPAPPRPTEEGKYYLYGSPEALQALAEACVPKPSQPNGIRYTIKLTWDYDLQGRVSEVYIADDIPDAGLSYITVDGWIEPNDGRDGHEITEDSYIYFPDYPELGDTPLGEAAHSDGGNTQALSNYTRASGRGTKAIGEGASTDGIETIAVFGAHAEGGWTEALAPYVHTEGNSVVMTGQFGHGEGYNNNGSGVACHVEGRSNEANADHCHVEGLRNVCNGENGHVEGRDNVCNGKDGHVEGSQNIGDAENCHVEGSQCEVRGKCGHAEGWGSQAYGEGSHAENYSYAHGKYTHSQGYGTVAASDYQSVMGKFNVPDETGKYAHIVGNGSSRNKTSNAHTLDWEGNAWYAGNVECSAVVLTSPNGTKFKLVVSDDGQLAAEAIE